MHHIECDCGAKTTKTTKVIISQDNLDLSVLSGLGSCLEIITPDQNRIFFKNKRKETPALSILRKESIPETVNPRKIFQGDYIMPPEK